MPSYFKDFADFNNRIWLNAASEGPLPLVAAQALRQAVEWKSRPYELTIPKFIAVPFQLKQVLGRLINVPAEEVILGNSATYGLHLIANGFPWSEGDEIIVMENDFPTDVLPWLALEKKGVTVSQVKPAGCVLTPEEVANRITSRTKLVCLPHVHSFTGYVLDVKTIASICRQRGVFFILNAAQSTGSMDVDVTAIGADALTTAGYKWLCGPYGTGFCWIRKELLEILDYNQAYWISELSEHDLAANGPLRIREVNVPRKFDVFGTANFFNFVPWRASVEYFLNLGLSNVKSHNDELADLLIRALRDKDYTLISPSEIGRRSHIVVFSHRNPEQNSRIFEQLKNAGIYLALWKGNLRASAHIYNTPRDIERLAELLP